MSMQPSTSLLNFLASPEMENCKLAAYLDGGGVPTIGVGHTQGVKIGDSCTYAQAMQWQLEDMSTAAGMVNSLFADLIAVGSVAQNEFDAFTSLGFNIGIGNLKTKCSAVGAYIAGNKEDSAQRFLLWNKVSGAPSQGLLKRRRCEAIILLGQPWQIAQFADESSPYSNTASLTRCIAAYAD